MVLNPQKLESYQATPAKEWKWEKRHWLLVIALGCLALWWFGAQIKETAWINSALNYLPVIGGMAFAADSIIKLI